MTAYVIFIKDNTTDQAELDIYNGLSPKSSEGHAATILAAFGGMEVLEGPPAEGAVIASFASMDEAKAWYFSPLYQQALKHRRKGANYRVMLIDGVR